MHLDERYTQRVHATSTTIPQLARLPSGLWCCARFSRTTAKQLSRPEGCFCFIDLSNPYIASRSWCPEGSRERKEKSHHAKIVLAYSGGLDTSVIVSWLRENYPCEVITFTADLGQEEELERPRGQGPGQRRVQGVRRGHPRGIPDGVRLPDHDDRGHLRAAVPAGHFVRPPGHGQERWSRSPTRKAPTPFRTAARAKATTRCALS